MFKIEIKTGGAAFRDFLTGDESDFEEAGKINRILMTVQKQLADGLHRGSCFDVNGNKVGEWSR